MASTTPSYDLVLVARAPGPATLPELRSTIDGIHQEYRNVELMSMDLFFVEQRNLIVILHFAPDQFDEELSVAVTRAARQGGLRLLDPMSLSDSERDRFYDRNLTNFTFLQLNAEFLGGFFDDLHTCLSTDFTPRPELADSTVTRDLDYSFPERGAFFKAYMSQGDGHHLLFISSDAAGELAVGEQVGLTLRVGDRQGPVALTARVFTLPANEAASLGLELLLPPDEYAMFEAFLSAVRRDKPWPEQSGRTMDRIPIKLLVAFESDGTRRQARTDNICRGGLFVSTTRPPAMGTILDLELIIPGRDQGVILTGEIVHSVDGEAARARKIDPGAGVRFTQPAAVVSGKLNELLAPPDESPRHTALLVDDDRFFRTLIGRELTESGFSVLEAADGDEALQRLMDNLFTIDVLVADYFMPGLTGPELVTRIRTVGGESDLPIVLLTGKDLSADELGHVQTLGVDKVLSKRDSADHVIHGIKAVIRDVA